MNASSSFPNLTSGPIPSTIIGLSAPMLLAILSMMTFNLVDTYFVAQLGTIPLAALTLTFPVAMVIATFTLGLGAMAAISRCIGEGDRSHIQRYATDALTLSVLCVVLLTAVGMATMEPLFRTLGATDANNAICQTVHGYLVSRNDLLRCSHDRQQRDAGNGRDHYP